MTIRYLEKANWAKQKFGEIGGKPKENKQS
jgi:hypothetical protein